MYPCLDWKMLMLVAKLVIISGNCPPLRKSELEYYAMLAKVLVSSVDMTYLQTNVHHYTGNKWVSQFGLVHWLTIIVRSLELLVENCSGLEFCRFRMEEILTSFLLNNKWRWIWSTVSQIDKSWRCCNTPFKDQVENMFLDTWTILTVDSRDVMLIVM